ncbi:hypothetical protein RB623_24520 [Mesorhizobium sp. LHD-90]|uniref:hypothetical protein n=1 Tax=Mesorhizobium sp. LHD-90 TaxID=3071414 RepID=UPI0027DFE9F0|nr:hypothetical protein [Mesorhizobium sp. LHD-90]MDQ6437229.1 hypothetical protein [Mesorhizobium sp. LHD-90]
MDVVAASLERQASRRPGVHARLRKAFPSWRIALAGALLWGLAMAGSAAVNLLADGWQTTAKVVEVATVFAAGAALAFPAAYAAAGILAGNRGWETRLASAFLAFSVGTIGITALIYALDYRQYYAAWHAEAFSFTWMHQFAFTLAGALVQFAVTGVRFYFPLGFLALAAVSAWFAHRAR